MKSTYLTCILLVFSTLFFAQTSKIDSLESMVNQSHGRKRVAVMNELCGYYQQLDLTKAEEMAENALYAAKLLDDKRGLANVYDNFGNIYFLKKEYLPAFDAFRRSLELRKKISDETGQADSKMNLGKIGIALSDFAQAKKELKEALVLLEKKANKPKAAECHDLLGKIALVTRDLMAAKQHFLEAQQGWHQQLNPENEENSALNLTQVAFQLGDNTLAQAKALEALQLSQKNGNKISESAIYAVLASICLFQNDLDLAAETNERAFALNSELSNELGLAENYLAFAEIAVASGKITEAFGFLEKSTQLLDKQGFTKEKTNLLKRIVKVYSQTGEHRKAREASEKALEAIEVLAEKEIAEFQKKRHQLLSERLSFIAQQEKIKALEILNSNDRKIRALMFVLIGFAGLLAAVVYVFYRKNLKDNEQLQAQNEEILQQKAVFDEMNKELGIKNISLEMLNKKLVEEIAERECVERSSFDRDRFLVTMSTKMRTPLNAITGLTYLLLDNQPRPDQVEQLRTLQFSANELVVFINDILDFSKIDAGKIDLQCREFDLGDISNTVFNNFVKKAAANNLLFYFSFDSQIPRNLLGDTSRFYQILSTLLLCCLENTSEGMIRAEIFLHEENEKEVIVRMVIESPDGGTLVSALNLEPGNHAGEAEFQINKMSQHLLSFAVTKRLVELQHGRLDVQNVFGEATRFTVLMPFKKVFSLKKNLLQISSNDHSHLRGSHILLVEDAKINQLVVSKILNKHGISVITADNGFEALEQVNLHDFDLILMDIQMPEMDGYRATSEIRKLASPAKNSVPIIALTSSAFLTEKDKAVLFGMNDHVGKPFSPEELLDKIASCLVPKF